MILIVTNKGDVTADFGVVEMQRRGISYVRLNTEDFPQTTRLTARLANSGFEGYLKTRKASVPLDHVRSVWFRRPVPPVPSPDIKDPSACRFSEAESLACLEGLWRTLDCFWVSKPDRIRAAESKLLQLRVARELGFSIPRTVVTSEPQEARDFFADSDEIVYKPLRQGRLQHPDGITVIFTSVVTDAHASELGKVEYAPCMFQEHVPKAMDIRVTVFGSEVFATEIHSQGDEEGVVDWRRCGPLLRYSPHMLPGDMQQLCVRLLQRLDLAFGAIDMILTPQCEYVFLEINPNGQWAWIEQRTGVAMSRSLVDLLLEGGQ